MCWNIDAAQFFLWWGCCSLYEFLCKITGFLFINKCVFKIVKKSDQKSQHSACFFIVVVDQFHFGQFSLPKNRLFCLFIYSSLFTTTEIYIALFFLLLCSPLYRSSSMVDDGKSLRFICWVANDKRYITLNHKSNPADVFSVWFVQKFSIVHVLLANAGFDVKLNQNTIISRCSYVYFHI